MEYTGITFGLEVLISVVFGAGGALGVWFKLKGTVNIQAVEISSLNDSLKDLREEKKESNKQLSRRYDALKLVVEKNKENLIKKIQYLTQTKKNN